MNKSRCPLEDYFRIKKLDYSLFMISIGMIIGFIFGYNYPKIF